MQAEITTMHSTTRTYATAEKARKTAQALLLEGDRFMVVPVLADANGTALPAPRFQIIFEWNKNRGGYVFHYAQKGHLTI